MTDPCCSESQRGESREAASAEATSSTTAVAVEPTVLLKVSGEAYVGCLEAFRRGQNKKQLAFFEGIGVFRGVKKQARGPRQWVWMRMCVQDLHVPISRLFPTLTTLAPTFSTPCFFPLVQALQLMNSAVKWVSVPRGALLQQAGAPMHGLCFIKEGSVAVMALPKLPPAGRPLAAPTPLLSRPMLHVALLGPGDYFGEDALTARGGGVHSVSCIAETTCLVGWLRPEDLRLLDRSALLELLKESRMRSAFRLDRVHSVSPKWGNRSGGGDGGVAGSDRDGALNDGDERRRPVSGVTWDMSIYEAWLGPARTLLQLERQDAAEIAAMLGSGSAYGLKGVEAGMDRLQLREVVREVRQMAAERLEEEAAELKRQTLEQEQRRQTAASVAGIAVISAGRHPAASRRPSSSGGQAGGTPRSATSSPRAGGSGAPVTPFLSSTVEPRFPLGHPSGVNSPSPSVSPVQWRERLVPAGHDSMPSVRCSLRQSKPAAGRFPIQTSSSACGSRPLMRRDLSPVQPASLQSTPRSTGEGGVGGRYPDGAFTVTHPPSSLALPGRNPVPNLDFQLQLGDKDATVPKLPNLECTRTANEHDATLLDHNCGSLGQIKTDPAESISPPHPPMNGLAKGLGKFRYRGWRPSIAIDCQETARKE